MVVGTLNNIYNFYKAEGYGFDSPIGKEKTPRYFNSQYATKIIQDSIFVPK